LSVSGATVISVGSGQKDTSEPCVTATTASSSSAFTPATAADNLPSAGSAVVFTRTSSAGLLTYVL